jgi:hypothetical protein
MDHATAWWPERVRRGDHEALVAAPAETIATIRDFLGNSAKTAGAAPIAAPREVRTASAAQAFEPVHGRGVGAWRRFERWFAGWNSDGKQA